MKLKFKIFIILCFASITVFSQKIDTNVINKIKLESMKYNPYKQLVSFCNIAGSRLNGSDGYQLAGNLLIDSLTKYGFINVHKEYFTANFKNWKVSDFKANITTPYFYPLTAVPKAYTCGTNGILKSEVVYLNTMKIDKMQAYSGKLKGKILMIDLHKTIKMEFEPLASRLDDSTLLEMSQLTISKNEIEKRKTDENAYNQKLLKYFTRYAEIMAFFEKEEVGAIIFAGMFPYGTVCSVNAYTSKKPSNFYDIYFFASSIGNEVKIPQIAISEIQYHNLAASILAGNKIEMELQIKTEEGTPNKSFSVFAEIEGTDLKNEIVLIGGHLDAYTAGQGAADNAAGVISCVEALRILKKSGIKPRRTIRIALWGSEEMWDFLGSTNYVKEHFINNKSEKLIAYFNSDHGAGAYRGIYTMESDSAKAIFDQWIPLINEPRFKTISVKFSGNSDHQPFCDAGLPGYMMIQDPLNYWNVFHSTMDLPENMIPEDLQYNAMVMVIIAYITSEFNSTEKN